jgi:hypothetical protein
MAARAERIGETFFMSESMRLRAAIATRSGSAEKAERLLGEAMRLATKQGARGLAAFARADLDALRSGRAVGATS